MRVLHWKVLESCQLNWLAVARDIEVLKMHRDNVPCYPHGLLLLKLHLCKSYIIFIFKIRINIVFAFRKKASYVHVYCPGLCAIEYSVRARVCNVLFLVVFCNNLVLVVARMRVSGNAFSFQHHQKHPKLYPKIARSEY